MYATIADHVKTAELFIKSGANLFAIDSAGRSALLWAAFYGHVDVCMRYCRSCVFLFLQDCQTAVEARAIIN